MIEKSLVHSPFFRPITAELPFRITPGPFEVTPTVLAAAAQAVAGHRSGFFRRLLGEVREMLLEALEIEDKSAYRAVVLTGTGTAAMEAMVAATVPGRQPLALVSGRFGQRLADIANLHNPATRVLDFGIGNPMDPERVEREILSSGPIDQLLFCIQDTREGLLNPFPELCSLAHRYGLFLTVDGISAEITEEIRPDQRGIHMFTASSGKAIRGLPGLGIVCGRRDVFESLDPRSSRTYYLNLAAHYRIQEGQSEPRFAPATALFFALHQALRELLEEGVEKRRSVIRERAARVRRTLELCRLELLRPADQMPGSVTSVLLPPKISFSKFQETYQERGFLVYSGSSVVEDCFQIGTAGYLTDEILDEALQSLTEIVEQFTAKVEVTYGSSRQ